MSILSMFRGRKWAKYAVVLAMLGGIYETVRDKRQPLPPPVRTELVREMDAAMRSIDRNKTDPEFLKRLALKIKANEAKYKMKGLHNAEEVIYKLVERLQAFYINMEAYDRGIDNMFDATYPLAQYNSLAAQFANCRDMLQFCERIAGKKLDTERAMLGVTVSKGLVRLNRELKEIHRRRDTRTSDYLVSADVMDLCRRFVRDILGQVPLDPEAKKLTWE
ncbi:hypothetical protein HY491_04445 [Candidatus Woesearchaeota archaeon]|nr:hypothetical protein [Candidatus Woesearchaeota archaeon]